MVDMNTYEGAALLARVDDTRFLRVSGAVFAAKVIFNLC